MERNSKAAQTAFYYHWKNDPDEWKKFATGVSLHGHTWHSHESLAFLPNTIKNTYFLPRLLHWAERRYHKKWHDNFDYSLGYWTSPVSPESAYHLESKQIAKEGLRPLISITDHDSLTAHRTPILVGAPASLEWTTPYNGAVFHIGVHNLPEHEKNSILESLKEYTANPQPEKLQKIFQTLDAIPDALTILNHPLSDQGRIGFEIHATVVREFLEKYGQWIHALEVNALQSWDINRRVTKIAEEHNFPIISGGDRHGFEPNGAINVTDAQTFSEFVDEIRRDRVSRILFMPQCRRALHLRYSENIEAIMDEHPELPGREFWHDRVFYKCPDGITRSITELSGGQPAALEVTNVAVGALSLVNRFVLKPIVPVFAENNRKIK